MKNGSLRLLPFLLSLLFCGCQSNGIVQDAPKQPAAIADNSRTSVDWPGVYRGTLPCADCPGIDTKVTLRADQTFRIEMVYIDRNVKPFIQDGSFSWYPDGLRIQCVDRKGGRQLFQVGENQLFQLDGDGNRITGEIADRFVLRKVSADVSSGPDAALQETYWKLTMMLGKPVTTTERQQEAHLVLERNGTRVHGSGGCNRFFGTCELLPGNRIHFSKLGSTMMACPDMMTEQRFFSMLEQVDRYSIKGNILELYGARLASPLARFEAVYLK